MEKQCIFVSVELRYIGPRATAEFREIRNSLKTKVHNHSGRKIQWKKLAAEFCELNGVTLDWTDIRRERGENKYSGHITIGEYWCNIRLGRSPAELLSPGVKTFPELDSEIGSGLFEPETNAFLAMQC